MYAGDFDQAEIDKILDESVKMKEFHHKHVMTLLGVCLDAGPAPYIIMPYMVNGSLLSYLKRERGNLSWTRMLMMTRYDDHIPRPSLH